MKPTHPRSAILRALASALILFIFAAASVQAETEKVNLDEAKAELAKAKSKEAKAEAKEGRKIPRKRLFFGRGDKKESVEPAEQAAGQLKSEKLADSQEPAAEKKARKPFGRLFGGGDDKESEQEAKESKKVAANSEEKRRFSLFGKNRDEAKKPEPKMEEAEVVEVEGTKEELDGDKKRRGFFGGMFAKDSSEKESKSDQADETKVAEAKPETKKQKEKEGGSLFGLFRSGDSKKFAQAEKTKLGNSIESNPAASSGGGALTKKSSNTGELGWYVVTEAATPFYAVGPGQPMPPEKILDRGSMLTVTKGGWGWCNVRLGSGELGVISAKSMRPATVAEVNRHTSPVATASKSNGSRKLFNFLSRGPAPELTLPSGSDAPIRNFGLLPSLEPSE